MRIGIDIDDTLTDISNIGVKTIRISNDTKQYDNFVTLKDWISIYDYISQIEFMEKK